MVSTTYFFPLRPELFLRMLERPAWSTKEVPGLNTESQKKEVGFCQKRV